MEKDLPFFYNLGLVGYPLGHSLSPFIHHASLSACGLQGDYRLYPIPPFQAADKGLEELTEKVRSGELRGLNITIPYKQTIIPYLDDLTPTASAIGAVNTLYAVESRLIGDNTDAPGFYSDLQSRLPGVIGFSRAIVLGAGGSARAVVYALLQAGWELTVAARRLSQAQDLINSLQSASAQLPPGAVASQHPAGMLQAIVLSQDSLSRYLSQAARHVQGEVLIVNATPLGMAPETATTPWPPAISFPSRAMLYDLVYNPAETILLETARSQGIPSVNGLGMLVEQAALSFERWTGYQPSRQAIYTAIAKQIQTNNSGA